METIRCPECGKDTSAPDGICEHCGFPFRKAKYHATHRWRCVNCGTMVTTAICSHCGEPSTERKNAVPLEKSNVNDYKNPPIPKKGISPIKLFYASVCSVSLILTMIIFLPDIVYSFANKTADEADYKSAIAEHMGSKHGLSINGYKSFNMIAGGGASASVKVTVAIERGLGSMEMSPELHLDEDCQITYCSLCDIGVGYNGGAPKQEKSSTSHRDYILRKAEELTGFSISVELDNYEEHEVTENGRTYIDIFAFINIEKMAGTSINSTSVFQLYAIINPDNEEDLFIAITGNATGEIYRYDHTSVPH